MMIRLSRWIAGGLPALLVFACAAGAQTGNPVMSHAPSVLPTGLGDAIDRDVARIREATVKFQTSEAAQAAGYKLATGCVQHQPAGAMGYHFNNEALFDATLDLDHPEVLFETAIERQELVETQAGQQKRYAQPEGIYS